MPAMTDWLKRADDELLRSGGNPEATARVQAYILRAIAEELRRVNEQLEDIRGLQKQIRDRTP